jgi:hypothetical protein
MNESKLKIKKVRKTGKETRRIKTKKKEPEDFSKNPEERGRKQNSSRQESERQYETRKENEQEEEQEEEEKEERISKKRLKLKLEEDTLVKESRIEKTVKMNHNMFENNYITTRKTKKRHDRNTSFKKHKTKWSVITTQKGLFIYLYSFFIPLVLYSLCVVGFMYFNNHETGLSQWDFPKYTSKYSERNKSIL